MDPNLVLIVDLVNAYKVKEGKLGVPELVALHYMIQVLLKHIEALHYKGKILVSVSVQTLSYVHIICW